MTEPRAVAGACAWHGAELSDDPRWQFTLQAPELDELDAALSVARARGAGIATLAVDDFPLPRLGAKLAAIGHELEWGCGVVRLRGFPLDRWQPRQRELVWMGISRHLGTPVFQNAHGELLREIRSESGDVGQRYGQLQSGDGTFLSSRARTASSAGLRFHTDRSDIVGLLCLGDALSGGLSRIASSVAVHNAMLSRDPRAAALLYQNLPRSRMGEEAGGESAWYALPVWGQRDGRFTSHYSRTYVEAGQLVEGVPRIGSEVWDALDLLAELADGLCLEMRLAPGDIQFINNHVIYHARTAFEDDPAAHRVRVLLRVWLCAPQRALPPGHEVLWRATETGVQRGGIGQHRLADRAAVS